ncbi:hypothetical protein CL6EHI_174490 [Entamoeba histolytica]|uniref:Uncharacterized protein n=3 Tax=Entamoeba histolytica TaxID=5759 RepID=C4LZJ7_ENTH1|nr:hypothetical protein EHI_174490 [Entamoeba histolytica HM-1:IMSS]EAL47943.1 hypothetical protein EHI_174490 [Entamoeba histolytica HM-1:IMSS]EMD45945.1 Hypothetical protein EHI5A_102560 [Entamoeba histolytica KU27]GAT94295.1 hypothetical protein CL6EHI_174490 [Entamoeba histolytica]|eukprot:XP_653329.1 hypothetical protein EHI_174490 [Entamoeba histolytica HM-1:IMSS]
MNSPRTNDKPKKSKRVSEYKRYQKRYYFITNKKDYFDIISYILNTYKYRAFIGFRMHKDDKDTVRIFIWFYNNVTLRYYKIKDYYDIPKGMSNRDILKEIYSEKILFKDGILPQR